MTPDLLPVLDATTGVLLVACGSVAWIRRRSSLVGALLVLAGVCWFLGNLSPWLLFLHRGPLVHLHVTYPTGRVHRPLVGVVAGLAYAVALVEGVAPNAWATALLALLVAGAALELYARTSGRARKAAGPALVAALGFAGVLAASTVNILLGLDVDLLVAVAYDLVVCVIAAGLTVDLIAGRWTEATVADLVGQLAPDADATGLQAALRRTLGDPDLVLGYWIAETATYVDDTGRTLDVRPRDDQVVTVVEEGGGRAAVLLHSGVNEDPRLLQGAVAAVRLTVGNARMRVEAAERVKELAATRRRIVEAGDHQRRRLTEELAGGAGRRLDAVADIVAGLGPSEASGGLQDLADEIDSARRELHELALGIRPPALEEGGLRAALPVLAARAAPAVTVDCDVERLAPAVESALYFVCAEGLTNATKHAAASEVVVRVTEVGGVVEVVVADDGRGGARADGSGLRGLTDRVEALGGTFTVESRDRGGTRIVARIPTREGAR